MVQENLLEERTDSDVVVVILGGGKGTRLYPLTKQRAKPAVSFGGKYRLIDIPITNCLASQLNKIFILTQYNSFSLNRHIWQAYSREVSRDGFIDVIAAEQTDTSRDWFQGTADAVRKTMQYLLYHTPKYVLILSGDQVYSMDYNLLIKQHLSKKADVTVAAHYTAQDEITGLGIMKVADDMRVINFYEKPATVNLVSDFRHNHTLPGIENKPFLASMGIYLFNTQVLIDALKCDETDFGKSIIPKSAKQFKMFAYPCDGYWEDVGTIKTFYEANMEWLHGGGIASIFQGGGSIITHSRMLPPSSIENCLIEHSIISDGCTIRAREIRRSIIGVRATIGKGSIIEDSLIMGNQHTQKPNEFSIGSSCVIKRAILDKDVIVGAGSKITNVKGVDEEINDLYVIRSGIVVIAQNTVIPPGTII
ncbi:MAG: hypothetical protein JW795_07525 [Chitinivibrionales bacterium]|nr:hypothetical protein [Chitinivibrionales bacterium]